MTFEQPVDRLAERRHGILALAMRRKQRGVAGGTQQAIALGKRHFEHFRQTEHHGAAWSGAPGLEETDVAR